MANTYCINSIDKHVSKIYYLEFFFIFSARDMNNVNIYLYNNIYVCLIFVNPFFLFLFLYANGNSNLKKTYTITENDVNIIHLLFLDKQNTHIRSTLYLSELYRVHLLCVLSFSSLSTPGFVKFRFNRQCNWLFNHAIVFSFFFEGGGYIPKIYITRWRQTLCLMYSHQTNYMVK